MGSGYPAARDLYRSPAAELPPDNNYPQASPRLAPSTAPAGTVIVTPPATGVIVTTPPATGVVVAPAPDAVVVPTTPLMCPNINVTDPRKC